MWGYNTINGAQQAPYPATALGMNCTTNGTIENNLVEMYTETGGNGFEAPIMSPENNASLCAWPTANIIFRNNTVHMPSGGVGIISSLNGYGTGAIVENNAVWTTSDNSCFSVNAGTATGHPFTETRYPSTSINTAGNYCVNDGSPATVLWVDPANHNYRPVSDGPLIGTGNASYFAPVGLDSILWSPSDPGVSRVAPIDIGAVVH